MNNFKVNCNFKSVFSQCGSIEDVRALASAINVQLQDAANARLVELTKNFDKKIAPPTVTTDVKLKSETKSEVKSESKEKKQDAPVAIPQAKEEPKKSAKKKSEKPHDEYGKIFQGVPQAMKITAKLRNDLGLTIKRYVKKDGTESKVYIFRGAEDKATKVLHDLLASESFAKIAHYKGWANGYVVNEKDVDAFSKTIGVKVS